MAHGSAPSGGILDGVRERFEQSTDLTVGIEEEYQLLDPATLALTGRFEEMMAAADEPLRDRLAGELIASEIEYRTGRHVTFPDAARELVEGRLATLALADRLGIALGISGVHPFSPWTEQRIIDTPHYRRLDEELGYVAWTNNTWSVHLHAGVRGADRAVAVSTAMRSVLPELLALSANSAVFMGRLTRLHSTRTQIFTKSFPRCGIPDAFASWDEYARLRRSPRADALHRREHPDLVERAPAPPLRHRRGAHLRRPDRDGGGARRGGPVAGLHRPVPARRRRGPAAARPRARADRGERLAGGARAASRAG